MYSWMRLGRHSNRYNARYQCYEKGKGKRREVQYKVILSIPQQVPMKPAVSKINDRVTLARGATVLPWSASNIYIIVN
ncbi:hypothetical protein HYV81_02095 [Candidatus Woesearchaeota archaeon]|nr:hypothetical protein [Candidatus Woesearchaeota archaeon]